MIFALLSLAAASKLGSTLEHLLELVETELERERDFEMAVHSSHTCYKDGQCYNGANAATECCAGAVIDAPVTCAKGPQCAICKKAATDIKKKLASKGCARIILEDAALCEIIGVGPEDPLADVCAVTVAVLCPIIAKKISQNIDAETFCEDIGLCGSGNNGRFFGTECGCVGENECTHNADACCAGLVAKKFDWSSKCAYEGMKTCVKGRNVEDDESYAFDLWARTAEQEHRHARLSKAKCVPANSAVKKYHCQTGSSAGLCGRECKQYNCPLGTMVPACTCSCSGHYH